LQVEIWESVEEQRPGYPYGLHRGSHAAESRPGSYK
jgi:hypothetical protein